MVSGRRVILSLTGIGVAPYEGDGSSEHVVSVAAGDVGGGVVGASGDQARLW